MKRILALGGILVVMFALGAFLGCGDDEDKGTGSGLDIGDTTSLEFQAARDMFEQNEGLTEMTLDYLFDIVDSVYNHPDFPGSAGSRRNGYDAALQVDSFLLVYHAGSQYWYAYIMDAEGADTMILQDSVQFLHGVLPVQWPDSALLTGIKTGLVYTFDRQSLNASVVAHQLLSIVGNIAGYGDVVINGSQSVALSVVTGEGTVCNNSLTMNATFSNIALNIEDMQMNDACPTAGKITHTGNISIDCEGDYTYSYSGSWAISQTFDGNEIHYVFENSTTRWTYTDYCHEGLTRHGLLDHPVFGGKR
ncbi:MAG TPA: hypothetical protein VMY05_07160 [Acidobacteriota bacterium]|nr:hypothetical protein [Acidobacteriota bacterium]